MNDTDVEMFIELLKEKISNLSDTLIQREKYNNDLREENVRLKRIVREFQGIEIKNKSDAEIFASDPLDETSTNED
tara:strand:+ start:14421 stop:14648 length:228 start_codon:yes stop_codon:yes gene_type:complete